jgi:hypothetical protein
MTNCICQSPTKCPTTINARKLIPLLGKYVRVSGTSYERKGTHAIAIHDIQELNDAHLTTEDQ